MYTKVLAAAAVSSILMGCSDTQVDATIESNTVITKAEYETVTHGVWEDKMEGTKTYYSYLTSTNTVDFDFPHDKNTRARLFITSDNMMEVRLSSGQVICNSGSTFNSCWVKFKFDDEKPTEVRAYGFDNGKYNGVWFCPGRASPCSSKSLINKIKNSKKLLIEVEVYQEGYPIFEFDTSVYEDHPETVKN